MKTLEHEKFSDEREKVFKEFYIEERENYDSNVVIIDGKGRIAGNIEGDVVIIFSNVEISGNIEGDLVSIGSNLKINGGSVEGNTVLVATKISGQQLISTNDIVKINFPLLSFLLKSLKPIVIRKTLFKKKIEEVEELVVRENEILDMRDVKLKAKRVIVNGKLKIGSLNVQKEVVVKGSLQTGAVNCCDLFVSGVLKAGAVNVKEQLKIEENGKLFSGAVNCTSIVVNKGGLVRAGAVNAKEWKVKGKVKSPAAAFKN